MQSLPRTMLSGTALFRRRAPQPPPRFVVSNVARYNETISRQPRTQTAQRGRDQAPKPAMGSANRGLACQRAVGRRDWSRLRGRRRNSQGRRSRHAGPGINPVEDPNGFGPQIMELMRKARPNADISVRFWTPPGVLLRPAAGLKRLPAAFSGFLNAARPPPRPQGCRPACRPTWRGGYASWRAGPAKPLPTASGRSR